MVLRLPVRHTVDSGTAEITVLSQVNFRPSAKEVTLWVYSSMLAHPGSIRLVGTTICSAEICRAGVAIRRSVATALPWEVVSSYCGE
jgi:hypothetical protein